MAKLRGTSSQIAAARGDEPVDLCITGGYIFANATREWLREDLAIKDGLIVGWGIREAIHTIDVQGAHITPGFIDAHMHLESTKLWLDQFVMSVLPTGTTAVAADPHEIANVFGVSGIEVLSKAAQEVPFTFAICASSCVPASHFESSGAEVGPKELASILEMDSVVGVAEVMNYPGVIAGDPEILEKISLSDRRRVDGHAPGVRGRNLDAYLTAGVESDHECTTYEEAHEKRRKGMWVFLRQGSATRNLAALARTVIESGTDRAALCTDDREPDSILELGHMNDCVRVALKCGIKLEDAIVLATSNAADYHGLYHLGSLAPGHQADLVVFKDISTLSPTMVFQAGKQVAQDGRYIGNPLSIEVPSWMLGSVHLHKLLSADDFQLPVAAGQSIRAIEVSDGTIVTKEHLTIFTEKDLSLSRLSVIERHHATGRIGLGIVKGFGIREGAIASTVAHDAHNLMVLGGIGDSCRSDMAIAANRLAELGGGQVVCHNGRIVAEVPLRIGGLMSTATAREIADELEIATAAARRLGVSILSPFGLLSFLGLSVIGELKLTDKGLVDVEAFKLTTLLTNS